MQFSNPLLLSVKMFLADVRSWRFEYKFPNFVCTDFAKLIFDAATARGMRCGYAIVSFEGSKASHAIVAFETDHGLIYIEPQSGEQEYIEIGRSYSDRLAGVPEDSVVSNVEIIWNDERPLRFIQCSDCGYLLPICCPMCGDNNINFIGD